MSHSASSPKRLLLALALLTAAATVERLVRLAAPMPLGEALATLHLADHRLIALAGGTPARQGRDLSHGVLRRFQLTPHAGGAPLTLSLLPVRSRTGTEISEQTRERKGLNMVAVAAEVPSFALIERRLLTMPRPNAEASGAQSEQVALGRSPADPKGAITRLQACLTPAGVVGVSASTLLAPGEEPGPPQAALQRRLGRLAGLLPTRHECLAVQLESPQANQGQLLQGWRAVREALAKP
jgi:hypothetical protein